MAGPTVAPLSSPGGPIPDLAAWMEGLPRFRGRSLTAALPFQMQVSEALPGASQGAQERNSPLIPNRIDANPAGLGTSPWLAGRQQALAALQQAAPGAGLVSSGNGTLSVGGGAGGPDRPGAPGAQPPALEANQIIVQWSPTSTAAERLAAVGAIGGTVASTIHTSLMQQLGQGVVEAIRLAPGMTAEQAIRAYANRPGVELAEVDWVVGTQAVSNDPYYTTSGRLWGMYSSDSPTNVGPSGTTNQFGSQAEQAWAQGYTGSSKVVSGVIDTGIDYTHPDLYRNIWLNQGEIRGLSFFSSLTDINGDGLITFHDLNHSSNAAFVSDINLNGRIDAGDLLQDSRWADGKDNDGNGYIDDLIGWDFWNNSNDPYRASDGDNHGTHVAGTIGGIGGNGLGVAGVNWDVQLMALKFLGPNGGYTSGAIDAVNYYADITARYGNSAQYVGTNNSWGGGGYSSTLNNAIITGGQQGNLFVAAAGNNSTDNDSTARYPTNYSTLSALGWDAVVSVAALASNGSLASFSNWGATTVDLGAPGVSINSTLPGGYGSSSGTSMASPHVAGAIALYAAANPTATPQQILEALYASTAATSSLNGKTATNGRLDVNAMLSFGVAAPGSFVVAGATGLTTTEGGTGASFTVALSEAPTADVVLRLSSSDPATGGPTVAQLVFTSANWDQPQTVTLASVDDWLALGNRTYQVLFDPAESTDSRFSGVRPAALSVQHLDNDTPVLGTSAAQSVELVDNVTYSLAPQITGDPLSGVTLTEGQVTTTTTSGNGRNRTTTTTVTSALDAAEFRFDGLENATALQFSGFRTANSEGDDFRLQLSSNGGSSWSTLHTVSNTTASAVTVQLASPISGSALVRFVDTDRSAGNSSTDTLTIDSLAFVTTLTDLRSTLTLQAGAETLEEGGAPVTLTLLRSGGDLNRAISVNLERTGVFWDEATLLDENGTAVGASVSFAAGQTERTLQLSMATNDGATSLANQSLNLALVADPSQPFVLGSASAVTVALADEGTLPDPITRWTATGESTTFGSVSGSLEDTHTQDASVQTLTEVLSGGRPANRTSQLEHTWFFDEITGATSLELVAATSTGSADRFRFEYALNGGSWQSFGDPNPIPSGSFNTYSWSFGPSLSGSLAVRVTDTDRSAGEQTLDWIKVDSLALLA